MRALLSGFLLLPLALRAQPRTTAEARLEPARITVGSPARLTLEVHHRPLMGALQWPTLADTFNKLEVLQRCKIDTLSDGENTVYRQEILLTGFDSVATAVPPLVFAVRPDLGAPYTTATERLPLLVSTVPVDTTQPFRPIRDIVAAPAGGFQISNRWLLVLAGIALLGLALFSFIYMRGRRKQRAAAPRQGTALEQLDALQAEGLLQKGAVKEHYTKLADILRDEIARRYRLTTRDRPSGEILPALAGKISAKALEKLRTVLAAADAVKFAKARPDAGESAAAMAAAREVVAKTGNTDGIDFKD